MKIHIFKTGAFVLCAGLIAASLTGCSSDKDDKKENKEYSTAAEFLEAYSAAEHAGHNVNGSIEVGTECTDGETVQDFGMDMSFDIDTSGADMHGTVTMGGGIVDMFMSMSDEGDTEKLSSEFYYSDADKLWYTKDSEESGWCYSEDDTFESLLNFAGLNFDGDKLKNAEFKADKDNKKYTLSLPMADMYSSEGEDDESDFSLGFDSIIADMLTDEEFQEKADGKCVVYTFDMDTTDLLSIKTDKVEYTSETPEDETSDESEMLTYTISYYSEVNLSDYGKIDSKSVAVPDDIKSSAVDYDEYVDSEFEEDFGDEDSDEDFDWESDEDSLSESTESTESTSSSMPEFDIDISDEDDYPLVESTIEFGDTYN